MRHSPREEKKAKPPTIRRPRRVLCFEWLKKSILKFENIDFVLVGESTIPNKFWVSLKFRMDFDEAAVIDSNTPISLLDVYFGVGGKLGVMSGLRSLPMIFVSYLVLICCGFSSGLMYMRTSDPEESLQVRFL